MPGFLRQATASQVRAIGPFVDDTDFKTAETALTIANTDVKLVVNGGASANKNSGGGTHRVNGVYGLTFDATDTATVGEMQVSVVVAGALPVFDKFIVVEEAVYDALYAAAATGPLTDKTGFALTAAYDLAKTAAQAGDAMTLTSGERTSIVSALFATAADGAVTFVQLLRGMASALMGKASGLGTSTGVFRDLADSKDRITATIDSDGNRTAVTRDLT